MKIIHLCLLTAPLMIQGCKPCKEEIWNQSLSPDGRWKAVVVMRDCGATSPETLSLNVATERSQSFPETNNALVVKHGHAVDAAWTSNSQLEISCNDCVPSEILKQRNQIGAVHVSFRLPQ